jgi:hypothetical protein
MNLSALVFLALCLAACVAATSIAPERNATKEASLTAKISILQERLAQLTVPKKVLPEANAVCQLCIEEGVAYINVLMNEILNNGIIWDCGDLCTTYLPNKYEQDFCEAMCDGLGIYSFIDLLMNTDLDAVLIYGCQEIDACPIGMCNGTCMDVVKFVAKPNPAPVGQDVHLLFTLNITQAWTGTGVLRYGVTGPNSFEEGSDSLIAGGIGPVGLQTLDISFATKGKKNGGLSPGTYQAVVTVCNGDCDTSGKVPYQQLLAQGTVNFKLTK